MANKTHPKCAIRSLAGEAMKRLAAGSYDPDAAAMEPPRTATPSQREIYLKLKDMYDSGEEVFDPISQLADKDYMATLDHEARQRYIFTLCFDYADMKNELLLRLAACHKDPQAGKKSPRP